MTKFLKRMMLLALLSVPWVSQAQTHYNVQVGSGTDQYQYVPNYSYYDYSYSQMLYTANEIGMVGEAARWRGSRGWTILCFRNPIPNKMWCRFCLGELSERFV